MPIVRPFFRVNCYHQYVPNQNASRIKNLQGTCLLIRYSRRYFIV
ncbi:hypothetical protein RMSM_01296 [Rhodopirellula maiorica SM1]|uniref:Uncharacterized protein n=1 Tax=Rhodopirellula maiorica SM1 TaxID=1265738 RepID=M5RRF2_9BACT|nr:hypothetical protein RMSM_01296 [Rhodopirellula maiorica SM1]